MSSYSFHSRSPICTSPAHLAVVYSQIYDVSLTTYAIMFLLLTAGAAFALNQSYVAAFEAEHTRLSIQAQKAHKGGDFKKHGFESQASMDASRGQTLIDQATAWTFLYGNGTFLFAFYFVAFYMFANADIVIGYCMATFAAAVVTFAITGAKLK